MGPAENPPFKAWTGVDNGTRSGKRHSLVLVRRQLQMGPHTGPPKNWPSQRANSTRACKLFATFCIGEVTGGLKFENRDKAAVRFGCLR